MAMLVLHKDLSIQQVQHIAKDILVHAKNEPFWGKFCRHDSIPTGHKTYSWRKLIYRNLTTKDLKNLEEGITPPPSKLEYAEFSGTVVSYGNWIAYTDESKRYNFDDVVRDAKAVLSDDAEQQGELRRAEQFYKGTCIVTAETGDGGFLKTLLKAKTILKKNKARTIVDNKYVCILPDEIANQVLVDYEKSLTHTTEKNAIIEGYLGCLGGFVLYARTDDVVYEKDADGDETGKGFVLFMGKSVNGLPVGTVNIGEDNIQVFDNGLGNGTPQANEDGTVYSDPLRQRGSVAYKVMGFGTRIIDDEAILRCKMSLTKITESVGIAEETRQHYVRRSSSPVAETTGDTTGGTTGETTGGTTGETTDETTGE